MATAVAAFSLIGAACASSSSDDVVTADDASVVTVAGSDSAIVAEGDSRPDGEVDNTSLVSVTVDVPEGVQLAGNVIVALEDVTVPEAEAVEVARVELPATNLAAQNNQVDVFLPLPLDGSIDVVATVHIDIDENGTFSQGDWISPDLVPVTSQNARAITVIMVQI